MPESVTISPALSPRSAGRDARLDFWRGLCLIDMVLVHLVGFEMQFGDFLDTALADYTRFAAGGFVFLSGLCIGMIFLPRVLAAEDSAGRWAVYRRIWRRSFKILLVQFVATIALILLTVPADRHAMLARPLHFAFDLLRFRKGNDLLLMYVGMLGVTPLVLELLRHRLWAFVAASSALVFALGTMAPWRVAFVPHGEFPIVLWQAVFITGVLFTQPLQAFDRAPRRYKAVALGLTVIALAIVLQSAYAREWGVRHTLLHLTFSKIPLSLGEMLRYILMTLLIMLVSNAAWGQLGGTRAAAFICLLGRNSLFVYVAHLFVQEGVATLAERTEEIGPWQSTYAVAMIALLGLMAYGVERFGRAKKSAKRPRTPRPPTENPVPNDASLAPAH